MTKNEFIRELREALDGTVFPSVVEDNIRYYESYFRSQISQGKTEQEVCDELGSPRLLAKSIAEANGGQEEYGYYKETVDESTDWSEEPRVKTRVFDLNSWKVKLGCLVSVIIMILILYMILHVFTAVIVFFGPVILAVLIIYLIYRMVKR